MMRQRTLKPAFFEQPAVPDWPCHPGLVYLGLKLMADDGWVTPADPEVVYDTLFRKWEKITVVEVAESLSTLQRHCLIWIYAERSVLYYWLPFCVDLTINRPSRTRYPRPPDDLVKEFERYRHTQGALSEPSVSRIVVSSKESPKGESVRGGTLNEGKRWLTDFAAVWRTRVGGEPNFGKLGRFLKPLTGRAEHETLVAAFDEYLRQTDVRYASPSRFAETVGYWLNRAQARACNAPAEYEGSGFAPPEAPHA